MYDYRYEKNDDFEGLVRYTVHVDQERLKKVYYQILINCGVLEHKEETVRGTFLPPQTTIKDHFQYKNVCSSLLRVEPNYDLEYNPPDFYKVYKVSYDQIHFPKIALEIEKIVEKNTDIVSLEDLRRINDCLEEKLPDYKKELEEKMQAIHLEDSEEIDTVTKSLEEVKRLTMLYQDNKDRKQVSDYKDDLEACFSYEKNGTLSYQALKELYFFESKTLSYHSLKELYFFEGGINKEELATILPSVLKKKLACEAEIKGNKSLVKTIDKTVQK